MNELLDKLTEFRGLVKRHNSRWFPQLILYGDGSGRLNIHKAFQLEEELFHFHDLPDFFKKLDEEWSNWVR